MIRRKQREAERIAFEEETKARAERRRLGREGSALNLEVHLTQLQASPAAPEQPTQAEKTTESQPEVHD